MSCIKPAYYPFSIWKNNSLYQSYTLDEDSTPLDLTGATITVTIYEILAYNMAILTLTIGAGITLLSTDTFEINEVIALDNGNYEWDCHIVFANGVEKTLWAGPFVVTNLEQ
jgi:hypothetical protein